MEQQEESASKQLRGLAAGATEVAAKAVKTSLTGQIAQFTQIPATALVCFMFYQLVTGMQDRAERDRNMYQDNMATLRSEMHSFRKAHDTQTGAMMKLVDAVDRLVSKSKE